MFDHFKQQETIIKKICYTSMGMARMSCVRCNKQIAARVENHSLVPGQECDSCKSVIS